MLDFVHITLLVGACIACYVAGKVNGAAGFAMLLIDHKIINKSDLDKLHNKLTDEE
jgi:hypothetical protein